MTTSIYTFQPVWTDAGITLAHSLPDGVAVKIDAVAVGDGGGAGYLPDEAATALVNEIERSSVIGGFPLPLGRSMQLNAVIEGSALAYNVREIAFYSGSTMVLVYSRIASPIIFNKTLGVGLSMPLTISLRRFHELAPDVEITIENSPDLPAMILQMQVHEAKLNPHPQYAGQAALTALAAYFEADQAAQDAAFADALAEETNARIVGDSAVRAELTPFGALGFATELGVGTHNILLKPFETICAFLVGAGGGGGGSGSTAYPDNEQVQNGVNGGDTYLYLPEGLGVVAIGGLGGWKGSGRDSGSVQYPARDRSSPTFNRSFLGFMRVFNLNQNAFFPDSIDLYGRAGFKSDYHPSNWNQAGDGGEGARAEVWYRNNSAFPQTITIVVGVGGAGGATEEGGAADATAGGDGRAVIVRA